MTNDTKAPARLWASYIRTQDGRWIGKHAAQDAPYKGATQYIRHDLHLSLVAAALWRAEELANIHSDWASDEIMHYRTETRTDAQAALEDRDRWIREETLMGAAAYVRAAFVGCDRVADAIETLIEKEQTDE